MSFGDDKEITILNRRISWKEGCLHYEADTQHVDGILKYFNLNDGSTILVVPFVRETKEELAREDAELPADIATEFRGLAARANYLFFGQGGHPIRHQGDLSGHGCA